MELAGGRLRKNSGRVRDQRVKREYEKSAATRFETWRARNWQLGLARPEAFVACAIFLSDNLAGSDQAAISSACVVCGHMWSGRAGLGSSTRRVRRRSATASDARFACNPHGNTHQLRLCTAPAGQGKLPWTSIHCPLPAAAAAHVAEALHGPVWLLERLPRLT